MLLVVALSVTGCGTLPDGTLDRSGFWGTFVGFVSDALDKFYEWTGDYGVAILLVTLAVRILMFPLVMKQIRYQKIMKEIQPELQKVREKYKDDREKVSQETMKLFQQYQMNPMAGCFPLIAQMPILFALYQAINTNKVLQEHEFLGWIALSGTQTFDNLILAVLSAITMYIQAKMTMVSNDPNMKMMNVIMPLMVGFFAWQFPAALGLYWVFGYILTIIQTYFTKGLREGQTPAAATASADKASKSGGKGDAKNGGKKK